MKHARPFYYIENEGFVVQHGLKEMDVLAASNITENSDADNSDTENKPFRFSRSLAKQENLPSEQALVDLASTMLDRESRDSEDSTVEAGYTYLGQFIAHEITHNGTEYPGSGKQLSEGDILQKTSPNIDLGSLYDEMNFEPGTYRLALGSTMCGYPGPLCADIPRYQQGAPQIPEARNDENTSISQLHVAMIRFHNAVASQCLGETGKCSLDEIKKIVIQHFQSVVLHDYLEKIVDPTVYKHVMQFGNQWYDPRTERTPAMPVEFAMAAFRFGHSMVRTVYPDWNEFLSPTLEGLLAETNQGGRYFTRLKSRWLLDWRRMFDFDELKPIYARRIDTQIAQKLLELPKNTLEFKKPSRNLAARTLLFGRTASLPSGQKAAEEINAILFSAKSKPSLIEILDPDNIPPPENQEACRVLNTENLKNYTPLWYYILREARVQQCGNRLGQLGSWIVMEVLYRLIIDSEYSILQEKNWKPTLPVTAVTDCREVFTFRDLLRFAGDLDPYSNVST